MVKSYMCTFDYAIHELSYANLMLYVAVLPDYGSKGKGNGPHVSADDPENKEIVKQILQGKLV